MFRRRESGKTYQSTDREADVPAMGLTPEGVDWTRTKGCSPNQAFDEWDLRELHSGLPVFNRVLYYLS